MFDSPAGFSGAYSIPNSERPTSVFSDSEIKSPPLQEWAIPIDDDTVNSSGPKCSVAEGWTEAFDRLKSADDIMAKEYKDEIDTLLVFAGLFSGVLTAFIIESNSALQEDTSLITADALYHLSQQLHDPSVGALPSPRPKFQAASSDVRINALWLASLVLSVSAALLAILVKQWLREYMTWTFMAPGKNTVALRRYRDLGWNKWLVRRWRDAIPTLLQTALLLFFWGLIELLWGLQTILAIVISVLIGIALATFLVIAFIPLVDRQCPYRSPFSWLLLRAWRCSSQTGSHLMKAGRIVLNALTGVRLRSDGRDPASLVKCMQDYIRSLSSVSWDFQDLQHMDNLSWSHDFAMQATADVVMNCPSSDVLSKVTPGIYEMEGKFTWIPIRNLWYLLEGLLGDDLASRENVIEMLKTSRIEGLYGASSLSKEFCQLVASLVRRTVCSQRNCVTEDLEFARCAVHLTSVLAHSEKSVFPYHTTTLAWLLHDSAPGELRQVAETNMASLALSLSSKGLSTSCWPDWTMPDIIAFFKATIASLNHHRTTSAQSDVSFVALHVASHHLAAINRNPNAVSALQDVFAATESWLRRRVLPTTASAHAGMSRVLRQDWCLLFVDVMTDTKSSPDHLSVVPASVACALLVSLGRTPDDEWLSWTDTQLSAERASVLANAIRKEAHRVYGPTVGALPTQQRSNSYGTSPTLQSRSLSGGSQRAPRQWLRAQRPPMVALMGRSQSGDSSVV